MKKIAFICVHNSCRSQIAEALCRHFQGELFECYSAGTELKERIDPNAVRLLKKIYGIDMEKTQYPKLIEAIPSCDAIITMGCNVDCPYLPAEYREDWGLDDPTGKSDKEYLRVIEQIENKVKALSGLLL